MLSSKAICVIGPTGVGKTSSAFSLARLLDGEVVNLDKIYTYKYFRIGTGLSDSLANKDIKKHLYCFLDPNEAIISPPDYAERVRGICSEITKRNRLPIIEGGSTTYFPALYEENQKERFIEKFICLKFQKNIDIAAKIRKRIDKAIGIGLFDEVKMGLKKFPNSLIMNDCHFVVPMAKYLRGEISLENAKDEVVQRCLDYIKTQMACFESYSNMNDVELTFA